MPTHTRRRPSSTQKTLPFTNSTKISKANTTPSSLKSKNPPTNPSKPASTTLKESTSSTPTLPLPSLSTPNPNPKPKTTTQPPLETHHHTLPSQIPQSQINKYWKTREALRLSPRVHQKNLETSEKVLREWDCMSQFGPAIGITRTQRWHRASRLGLSPPIEVLAVLVQKEGERSHGAGERAYVDELMK